MDGKVVVTKGIFPLPNLYNTAERRVTSSCKKKKTPTKTNKKTCKNCHLFPADSILPTRDPNVEQRRDLPNVPGDAQVWIPVPERQQDKQQQQQHAVNDDVFVCDSLSRVSFVFGQRGSSHPSQRQLEPCFPPPESPSEPPSPEHPPAVNDDKYLFGDVVL